MHILTILVAVRQATLFTPVFAPVPAHSADHPGWLSWWWCRSSQVSGHGGWVSGYALRTINIGRERMHMGRRYTEAYRLIDEESKILLV